MGKLQQRTIFCYIIIYNMLIIMETTYILYIYAIYLTYNWFFYKEMNEIYDIKYEISYK